MAIMHVSALNPGTSSDAKSNGSARQWSSAGALRANEAARRWQRGSISPLLLPPDGCASQPLSRPIEQVRLGRSPVCVSRMILGSMAIGSAGLDRERRIRTIRTALDVGITSIDSAPMYDLGLCEQTVGEAIRGVRGEVQILSHVGLRWDGPHGKIAFKTRNEHGRRVAVRKNSRPESVRLEIERSLAGLRIDVLDAVHVQMRDPSTPIEETMGALKDLMHEGKLRAIGVSTDFGPHEIAAAQRALGDVPLASVQVAEHVLERRREMDLLGLAKAGSIALLARSPLPMGLPTARPTSKPTTRPTARLGPNALQYELAPIAAHHGVSIATIALAWVLHRPAVSAVVVGACHPRQARAHAEAVHLDLSTHEQDEIRRAFEGLNVDPYANVGFARRALLQGRWLAEIVGRRLAR